ncbi:hypothetical protein [Nonomuraea sp. NPDC049141]
MRGLNSYRTAREDLKDPASVLAAIHAAAPTMSEEEFQAKKAKLSCWM